MLKSLQSLTWTLGYDIASCDGLEMLKGMKAALNVV